MFGYTVWQVGDEQQPTRVSGGTVSRASAISVVNNQGDDVMSEMARRLQERRARTDQAPTGTNSVSTRLTSICSDLCVKTQRELSVGLSIRY